MGILAGPTCSYNDYMAFIEGTCYQPRHQEHANGKENGKHQQTEPSPKVQHTSLEKQNSETEFTTWLLEYITSSYAVVYKCIFG